MLDIKRPFKLMPNRVSRTYIGGKLIDELKRKSNPKDSKKPEEWIGSLVKARNAKKSCENEGLSFVKIRSDKILLKSLISSNPEFYLGKKHVKKYGIDTALLVKILDSAERLTIQVHPDKEKARAYFDSNFGKTEAWYILGKRQINDERPYILLGFKPGISKKKWRDLYDKQDIDGMINSMHKFEVEPGDVFLVEGGIPHAIGPGCLMIEIQEPTDYTIRVEKSTPSGMEISDGICHQGIGNNKMFECFNYHGYTKDEILSRWKMGNNIANGKDTKRNEGTTEIKLIDYEDTNCFKMKLYENVTNYRIKALSDPMFSIFIVCSGEGRVSWDGGELPVSRGDSFFLPAGVKEIELEGSKDSHFSMLRCYPPE